MAGQCARAEDLGCCRAQELGVGVADGVRAERAWTGDARSSHRWASGRRHRGAVRGRGAWTPQGDDDASSDASGWAGTPGSTCGQMSG